MCEDENTMAAQDKELVDVLLDFIIVAANLAKKINQSMKAKKGVNSDGKNQRIGNSNQGLTRSSEDY